MKFKLMIQSLSPLALLTIIRNLKFVSLNADGSKLGIVEFASANKILLIVIFLCCVWILLSMWYYQEFKAFKWTDKKSGYQVKTVEENEEASLNFFLTIIIPLLIDDIDSIQGAITLFLIVVILMGLLYKTKLFYANPVLSLFGYHFYEFEFLKNEEESGKFVGISKTELKEDIMVEYKKINGKVMYVRSIEK